MKQGRFNGIWIILFLILGVCMLFGIYLSKICHARDDACKEIGYDRYDVYGSNCVSEDNYIEIYMNCDDSFFNPKCRVLKESIE